MDYRVKGSDLTSVADAIRTKGETSAPLSFPLGFVSAIEDIPSGGGATNFVTGTFKGLSTDKGSAISVSIPYTGTGYPLSVMIFPSGGSFKSGSAIAQLSQPSAVYFFALAKNDFSSTPTYDTDTEPNKAEIMSLYKYGTSETASRGHQTRAYYNSNATATQTSCVRLKDDTTMSVYIADQSYGFPDDIEFTYQVVYSA